MLCEDEDVAIGVVGVVGVVGIVVVPVVPPVSAFGRITRKTTAATATNRNSIPRTHPRMDHIFADLMFLFWSVHCKTVELRVHNYELLFLLGESYSTEPVDVL